MPRADDGLTGKARIDSEACERLLSGHRRSVYRIAWAILGDHHDAEDATQETFVKALRGMNEFDTSRAIEGWLRRIAVNCSISMLQRRERMPAVADERSVADGDPADDAGAADFEGAVRRALNTLPLRQRVAMTLFALEDMDLQSAAEAMGCQAGTVKSHLHRARQRLRELLSEYLNEDG